MNKYWMRVTLVSIVLLLVLLSCWGYLEGDWNRPHSWEVNAMVILMLAIPISLLFYTGKDSNKKVDSYERMYKLDEETRED